MSSEQSSLHDFLRRFVSLTETEVSLLFEIGIPFELKKGEHFLDQGQFVKKLAFFSEGYVRFYNNCDGEEKTRDFTFAPNMVTAFECLIQSNSSDVSIQALTTCKGIRWHYDEIVSLFDKHPRIHQLGRFLAEQAYVDVNQRYRRLLKDDAKERYADLMEKAPNVIQNIPLQYIASFLNVTPQHLSRIRKAYILQD